MNDNYVDDAFEMNDEQLEAELLRQLECLSSEDEEDHDTGDAKTYIKQQSISENNSPNYQILTTPTLSPPPPTDSAWSQLLATMNADTNHWDQYESELTSLRTSMSAVVPRSKETTTTANTTEEPLSPTSNTFFTGVPLPNEDTTNDTDSNTEDEDEDPVPNLWVVPPIPFSRAGTLPNLRPPAEKDCSRSLFLFFCAVSSVDACQYSFKCWFSCW
jgi:hypothetical protein